MDRLVRMSSKDNGAYVIVIDIDPVGDKVEYWMPGQNARVRAYNEILERVTVGHQGRASFIPASRVILENGPEIQPDGLHRSAKAHQLVAQLIADELLAQATSVGIRRQLSDA
jgi:lysophospholipase L1-like esterase